MDNDNDMTSMHKVSVQGSASTLAAIGDETENGSNESNGSTVCNSVGVSFAHQPAAPEDHRSSGTAGSSVVGLLEVIERDTTKKYRGLTLRRMRLRMDRT